MKNPDIEFPECQNLPQLDAVEAAVSWFFRNYELSNQHQLKQSRSLVFPHSLDHDCAAVEALCKGISSTNVRPANDGILSIEEMSLVVNTSRVIAAVERSDALWIARGSLPDISANGSRSPNDEKSVETRDAKDDITVGEVEVLTNKAVERAGKTLGIEELRVSFTPSFYEEFTLLTCESEESPNKLVPRLSSFILREMLELSKDLDPHVEEVVINEECLIEGISPLRIYGDASHEQLVEAAKRRAATAIEKLDAALEEISAVAGLVGHNRAIGPSARQPIVEDERLLILSSVRSIAISLGDPVPNEAGVKEQLQRLKVGTKKVSAWIAQKADVAAEEFVKTSAKSAAIGFAAWIFLQEKLDSAIAAIQEWISLLF